MKELETSCCSWVFGGLIIVMCVGIFALALNLF